MLKFLTIAAKIKLASSEVKEIEKSFGGWTCIMEIC